MYKKNANFIFLGNKSFKFHLLIKIRDYKTIHYSLLFHNYISYSDSLSSKYFVSIYSFSKIFPTYIAPLEIRY